MMTAIVRDRALSDEQAWAAVLGRDRRLDGRLFYGVASTGVYCRPSCPSRRPRRHERRVLHRAGGGGARGLPGLPALRSARRSAWRRRPRRSAGPASTSTGTSTSR